MTKRFGFTLAEVLITLGIIGVVAAMTMPTLMNQTNGAQYKAAYKKALSAISQGVTLNVALDGGSFADTETGTVGATTKPTTGDSVASILASRMNVVKAATATESGYGMTGEGASAVSSFPGNIHVDAITCDEGVAGCTPRDAGDVKPDTFLFFNDGSMFAFLNSEASKCTKTAANASDNKICLGVIDVNGLKGPNKPVECDQGSTATEATCTVKNPTDIYPVEFYDQTILPASPAAKAVLYGK